MRLDSLEVLITTPEHVSSASDLRFILLGNATKEGAFKMAVAALSM
jgi:hypothetical protein